MIKRKPYNLIGLAFNLLALVCGVLFFTTGFVRLYEWGLIVLTSLAAIFYVISTFQAFRK